MKKVWQRYGNTYYLGEASDQEEIIGAGIYRFGVDRVETPFLSRTSDNFSFDHKIYGMERNFIDRVKKTYGATKGNMGIILNGTKGTGKTVTAKTICNELGLPVILVSQKHDKLITFLNDLQQDVVVFIDEYEKYYSNYDNTLLTVLDGALSNEHRKFFLLTTNEIHVNTYLLQRPGRIRYIKSFGDLSREVVEEILDDLLINKSLRDGCLRFISSMSIITIDLVKSVIEEANIHNEDPFKFREFFNTDEASSTSYRIFKIEEGGEKLVMEYAILKTPPDKMKENSYFRVNGEGFGTIKAILPNNDLLVYKDLYEDNDDEGKIIGQEKTIYRIKPMEITHRYFRVGDIT